MKAFLLILAALSVKACAHKQQIRRHTGYLCQDIASAVAEIALDERKPEILEILNKVEAENDRDQENVTRSLRRDQKALVKIVRSEQYDASLAKKEGLVLNALMSSYKNQSGSKPSLEAIRLFYKDELHSCEKTMLEATIMCKHLSATVSIPCLRRFGPTVSEPLESMMRDLSQNSAPLYNQMVTRIEALRLGIDFPPFSQKKQ